MRYNKVKQDELEQLLLQGNIAALARAITLAENHDPHINEIIARLYSRGGKAHVIGITGSPGVGKSSLINTLTSELRARGKTVAVIAVDPSSPFTGGALLGDRIRMQSHTNDSGVFIRSLATRGGSGALAKATSQAVELCDIAGFNVIIIETAGAGQSEVDIAGHVHTVILVLAPGLGDEIQIIKAGIMEIADIFAVNKCDQPGADAVVQELQILRELRNQDTVWSPPACKVSARTGEGIPGLVEAMESHLNFLTSTGMLKQRQLRRAELDLRAAIVEKVMGQIEARAKSSGVWEEITKLVAGRNVDPASAADRILKAVCDSIICQ